MAVFSRPHMPSLGGATEWLNSGRVTARIKLSAGARRTIKRLARHRGHLTLDIVAFDASGASAHRTFRVRVRR